MQIDNTIYIIGAGAIGKALAVFLKLNHKNVIIIRGSVDDGSYCFERIEVELNDCKIVTAEIEIRTISSFSNLNGIVVFANKSFGNPALAKALKTKINNAPIVILQNGLNIEQPFIDNDFSQIYRCVLFATSQQLAKNKLRFKPVASSPIGIIKGDIETLAAVVEQLDNHNFRFKVEENIQPVIWTKTIVNCVFNSVCPLLETDNGIFYRDEKALQIARRVIGECTGVAKAKGIVLDAEKVENSLLLISKSSEGQFISTCQDIKNKRKTEIETLNFAIVNFATELNMVDFVQETKLLGELITIKSELI
ncbi:MAG: 2-dehydropantoate 2-reductase [Ferruginibacter sp.]